MTLGLRSSCCWLSRDDLRPAFVPAAVGCYVSKLLNNIKDIPHLVTLLGSVISAFRIGISLLLTNPESDMIEGSIVEVLS